MSEATYSNPVYDYAFPDPFVLKWCGVYWAYSTGYAADGRVFPMLHSTDLVHWQPLGGAMSPLPEPHPHYWAPEVTYDNGTFYLYYSVGNEATMHIRVATATHPAGPFVDSGRRLTQEDFAIDAHVFVDDDGTHYLFYATDFLSHSHIGTGTARDLLRDPFTVVGDPQPVTRARYDWQVYDPQRAEKGGVRWHTVEGPFVLKHKGRYYQMFSGGNWQNETYGVSYATTDDITTADEWAQVADGLRVLPILRTLPGRVIGPGHNSVVRGLDNRQLYCVYHRWNPTTHERVLAIDRQDWASERMLVLGPSTTPQPAPNSSTYTDVTEQQWNVVDTPYFAAEVSARGSGGSDYGIELSGTNHTQIAIRFDPARRAAYISRNNERDAPVALRPDFDFGVFHLMRVEVNARHVSFALDDRVLWQTTNDALITQARLVGSAEFVGFALSVGYEDLFTDDHTDLAMLGWTGDAGWHVENNALRHMSVGAATLTKGLVLTDYEFVVNVCLEDGTGSYGFYPTSNESGRGVFCKVERGATVWRLMVQTEDDTQSFDLPTDFDPTLYQHFRFRKLHGRLSVQYEATLLVTLEVTPAPTQVGLHAADGHIAFDIVRVTAL